MINENIFAVLSLSFKLLKRIGEGSLRTILTTRGSFSMFQRPKTSLSFNRSNIFEFQKNKLNKKEVLKKIYKIQICTMLRRGISGRLQQLSMAGQSSRPTGLATSFAQRLWSSSSSIRPSTAAGAAQQERTSVGNGSTCQQATITRFVLQISELVLRSTEG